MQKAIQYIYEKYPSIKESNNGGKANFHTNEELVFYQLSLFLQEPDKYIFNLGSLYLHLNGEELEFALEVIFSYFYNDTRLIDNKTNYVMKTNRISDGELFNQKMFSDYLIEQGFNYTPQKINVYRKRNKFPKGDLTIANSTYWFKSTVEQYLTLLKSEREGNSKDRH